MSDNGNHDHDPDPAYDPARRVVEWPIGRALGSPRALHEIAHLSLMRRAQDTRDEALLATITDIRRRVEKIETAWGALKLAFWLGIAISLLGLLFGCARRPQVVPTAPTTPAIPSATDNPMAAGYPRDPQPAGVPALYSPGGYFRITSDNYTPPLQSEAELADAAWTAVSACVSLPPASLSHFPLVVYRSSIPACGDALSYGCFNGRSIHVLDNIRWYDLRWTPEMQYRHELTHLALWLKTGGDGDGHHRTGMFERCGGCPVGGCQ